ERRPRVDSPRVCRLSALLLPPPDRPPQSSRQPAIPPLPPASAASPQLLPPDCTAFAMRLVRSTIAFRVALAAARLLLPDESSIRVSTVPVAVPAIWAIRSSALPRPLRVRRARDWLPHPGWFRPRAPFPAQLLRETLHTSDPTVRT